MAGRAIRTLMGTLEKNGRGTLRVVIAGSRSITSLSALEDAIARSDFLITEVVALGGWILWASLNGVVIKRFPADWGRFGRAAGHYRKWLTTQMAGLCSGTGRVVGH